MRLNRDKDTKSAERKVIPTSEFEKQLKQLLNEDRNGSLEGAHPRIHTNGVHKTNLNGTNHLNSPTNMSPQMSVSSTNSTTPREDMERELPPENLIETENFYLSEQNRHLKRELMHSKLNIDAMKKVAGSKEITVMNLAKDKERLENRVKHLEKVLNWFRDNASQALLEGCPFMPGHVSSPSMVSLSTTESESRMESIHFPTKPTTNPKVRRKSENFQFVKDFFKFSSRSSTTPKPKKEKNSDKGGEDWITCDDDLDSAGLTDSQMIGILPIISNEEEQTNRQQHTFNSLRGPASPTNNLTNPFNSLPSRNSSSKENGDRERSELGNHLFNRPSPSSSQTSLLLPTVTPPHSGTSSIEITEPEPDPDLPDIEAELANLTLQDLDLEHVEVDTSFEVNEYRSSIVEESSDDEGDVIEVKQRLVVTNHSPNDVSSLETSSLHEERVSIDEGVQVVDQVTRMSYYPVEIVESDTSSEHKAGSELQPPTSNVSLKETKNLEPEPSSSTVTTNLSLRSKLPSLPGLSPTQLTALLSATQVDKNLPARSPTNSFSELPLPPTPTSEVPPLPFKTELDRRHTLNNRLSLPPIRHDHKFESLDDDQPLSSVIKRSSSRTKIPLSVVINPTQLHNGSEPFSRVLSVKPKSIPLSLSAMLSSEPELEPQDFAVQPPHSRGSSQSSFNSNLKVSLDSPRRPDRPLPPLPPPNSTNNSTANSTGGVVHLNIKKHTPIRRRSSRRSNKVNNSTTSTPTVTPPEVI